MSAKIITTKKARRIASEWHGGQASALYAFSSSGTIIPGFLGEVRGLCRDVEKEKQAGQCSSESYWEVQDLAEFAEIGTPMCDRWRRVEGDELAMRSLVLRTHGRETVVNLIFGAHDLPNRY